jgi:Ner family transcriptional regulator
MEKNFNTETITTDRHPAAIVAGLWERGLSFRKLSINNEDAHGSLQVALCKPWPKAEKIIANGLGLPPWAIWPSRYTGNGKPNRGGPGPKPKLRVVEK